MVKSSVVRAFVGFVTTASTSLLSILQGVLLPLVVLRYWDASDYGKWVSIFAILEMFRFADLSHQNYVGNTYSRQVLGERDAPFDTIRNAISAVFAIAPIKLLCGVLLIVLTGFNVENTIVFLFLIKQCFLTSIFGMLTQVYRPHGLYARGLFVVHAKTIIPVIMVCLFVWVFDGGFVSGFTVYLVFEIICTLAGLFYTKKLFGLDSILGGEIKFGMVNFKKSIGLSVVDLFARGTSSGPVVLLERFAGGLSAGLFVTVRTLSNLVMQNAQYLLWPIAHDFLRMKESEDSVGMRSIFVGTWLLCGLSSTLIIVILSLYGDTLFQLWTDSQFGTAQPLLTLLLLSAVFKLSGIGAWTFFHQMNLSSVLITHSVLKFALLLVAVLLLGIEPLSIALALLLSEGLGALYISLRLIRAAALRGFGINAIFIAPWVIWPYAVGYLSIAFSSNILLYISLVTIFSSAFLIWGFIATGSSVRLRLWLNIVRLFTTLKNKFSLQLSI